MKNPFKQAAKSIIMLGELFSHPALAPVGDLLEENKRLERALIASKKAEERAQSGAREAFKNKENCHRKHEGTKREYRKLQESVKQSKVFVKYCLVLEKQAKEQSTVGKAIVIFWDKETGSYEHEVVDKPTKKTSKKPVEWDLPDAVRSALNKK